MISRLCLAVVVLGSSSVVACSSSNPPLGGTVHKPLDAGTDAADGSVGGDDVTDAAPVGEGGVTPDGAAVAAVGALAVGLRHACAVTAQGTVLCWGDNRLGQLGDGTNTQRDAPVAVKGLAHPAVAIAAGDEHTCALDSTGAVLCWGSNASGALGDGSAGAQRSSAGPVPGLSGATAIGAGGASTCAAMASGNPVCWGANGAGQLGDGSMMDRTTPSPTKGILGGVGTGGLTLAPGADHTCIIATGGAVECAGDATNGALGNGGNLGVDTYVSSGVTNDAVAVTSGIALSCALIDDGTVQCWGFGGDGELGDGLSDTSDMPVPVAGLAGVTSLAAGFHHVCAVSAPGVSCWGDTVGATLEDASAPAPTPDDATTDDADDEAAVAVTTRPVVAGLPSNVTTVAAGGGTCALTATGAVLCWGDNTYGQLGNGTTTQSPTPVAVVGLP